MDSGRLRLRRSWHALAAPRARCVDAESVRVHVLGARVWIAMRPRRCALRGLLPARGGKVPTQLRSSKVLRVKCAFACWASAPAASPASLLVQHLLLAVLHAPHLWVLPVLLRRAAASQRCDSEADASGETEEGAEEEDAGADVCNIKHILSRQYYCCMNTWWWR